MKKPLIELLPKSLVEIIIELKYLRNNKKTYQSKDKQSRKYFIY